MVWFCPLAESLLHASLKLSAWKTMQCWSIVVTTQSLWHQHQHQSKNPIVPRQVPASRIPVTTVFRNKRTNQMNGHQEVPTSAGPRPQGATGERLVGSEPNPLADHSNWGFALRVQLRKPRRIHLCGEHPSQRMAIGCSVSGARQFLSPFVQFLLLGNKFGSRPSQHPTG